MRSKLAWTNNELEDLLRQFDVALEASGIGIWQHNLRKNQTRWDEQLQRMYGVKKGEHDVVWLESVHPEDCAVASAIFADAIAKKSDYASQFRIIRPDGEIRHIRAPSTSSMDRAKRASSEPNGTLPRMSREMSSWRWSERQPTGAGQKRNMLPNMII